MKERPIIMTGESVRAILAGRKTQTRRVMREQPTTEPLPRDEWNCGPRGNPCPPHMFPFRRPDDEHSHYAYACPHGAPGDRLWVREAWRTGKGIDDRSPAKIASEALEAGYRKPWAPVRYEADGATDNEDTLRHSFGGGWGKARSPLHMPRWASRLTLEVTEVRVQRLQDINALDAMAEGARHFDSIPDPSQYKNGNRWSMFDPPSTEHCLGSPQMAFANAWDRINGARRIRVYNGELGTPRYGQKVSVVDTSCSWDSSPWVWALTFRRVDAAARAA